jgi:YHS domain-containing protein
VPTAPRRLLVILFALLLAALAPQALAHGARCPVCGMAVDTHDAKWSMTWNGETYYFCMEADRKAFEADPQKYGGVLKLARTVEGRAVTVLVRPRAPKPGDTCRLLVRVAPLGPDGMAPVESESLVLRSATARVWTLDRTRSPKGRAMRLQPTDEPATYGLAVLADAALPLRLRLELVPRDGAPIVTHVDVPVGEGALDQGHHPEGTAEAEPHDHPASQPGASEDAPPAADEPLTMEAQHRSMKVMARRWLRVGDLLESPDADPATAVAELEGLDAWRRAMPRFSLHKHADEKPEFDALTSTFAERLEALRDHVASRRWQGARTAWRAIDANDCTRCHLKFRWGVIPDLSALPQMGGESQAVPDLRGQSHAH